MDGGPWGNLAWFAPAQFTGKALAAGLTNTSSSNFSLPRRSPIQVLGNTSLLGLQDVAQMN